MLESSSVAGQLAASQEGLSSMKFIHTGPREGFDGAWISDKRGTLTPVGKPYEYCPDDDGLRAETCKGPI
jgi:hypothetical protein